MPIGTSGPHSNDIKQLTLEVRRSNFKVIQRRNRSRKSPSVKYLELCDKFYPNLTGTCYGKWGKCIYIVLFFYYLTLEALRHGSRSVTCNCTNACLYVSIHQMAPPQTEVVDI